MTLPTWALDLPFRIALAGEMGTGKSATAAVLRDLGYQRLAFADILRDVLKPIYGEIDKSEQYFVHHGDGTENGPTLSGRELLQQMGAAMRTVDSGVFLRAMSRHLHELGLTRIVIDDCRFPGEARMLAERNFRVYKLQCPSPIRRDRVGRAWTGEGDITELAISQIEAPTINTATIDPEGVVKIIAERNR